METKKNVAFYLKHWSAKIGISKVFYTRHLEGRKMLVKARLFHIRGAIKEVTKKSVIWK